MKIEDLLTQNDHMKDICKRSGFFADSYAGGEAYRYGDYLERHDHEHVDSFKRRKKVATFANKCANVVDLYTNYLFREKIARDLKLSGWAFDDYMKDADFCGNAHDVLMRELSRQASIRGLVGIVVDKPKSDAVTMEQEKANGIRPYISTYTPENIINFEFKRINGKPTLTTLVLREEDAEESLSGEVELDIYRVWRRAGWQVYGVEDDKLESAKLLDEGEHKMGEIPFVIVRNRGFNARFEGRSDIADIADINRRIYRLDSDLDEIIENTAYPMLEAPHGGSDIIGGSSNIVEYDPENPTARHAWLEPPHSSLAEIRNVRADCVDDILAIAKTGAEGQDKTAKSGVSLEIEFQQLNAILAEKAENMEKVENRIFYLFAKWQNFKGELGDVEYVRKFGIRDLSTDLDNAIKARGAIQSRTFDKEQAVNLASRVLADVDTETMLAIKTELDAPSTTDLINAV